MDSQAQAEAEWQRLSRKSPSLFADRTPLITEAQRGGHTFYRLRTSGFETMAAATEFCARSRAAGAACTIASF
jgi:tRNA(Glu) U13 pseudouridine synthase TruD